MPTVKAALEKYWEEVEHYSDPAEPFLSGEQKKTFEAYCCGDSDDDDLSLCESFTSSVNRGASEEGSEDLDEDSSVERGPSDDEEMGRPRKWLLSDQSSSDDDDACCMSPFFAKDFVPL
mmetsp:Transcript_102227/g.153142  ORF Transcript_102227/g.153142 Transcript_102227/m.153142 type:complete len:119 (+) Transcript_102227:811-1167(+)